MPNTFHVQLNKENQDLVQTIIKLRHRLQGVISEHKSLENRTRKQLAYEARRGKVLEQKLRQMSQKNTDTPTGNLSSVSCTENCVSGKKTDSE